MSLVLYCRFNGNSNDTSGNGNSYNVSYPLGIKDAAILYSSAKNGYSNFGNILNYTSGSFTFSFVMRIYAWPVDAYVIPAFKGPYNYRGYWIGVHATGGYFITNQIGADQITSFSKTIELGKDYIYTVVRSGSSVKIFVDSSDKTSAPAVHIDPASSSDNFCINSYGTGVGVIGYIQIDEYKNDNTAWVNSKVKNEYSRLKGFF
jgi:hypothetical protein